MYISYLANYNKQNLIESVVLSLVEMGREKRSNNSCSSNK